MKLRNPFKKPREKAEVVAYLALATSIAGLIFLFVRHP